MTSILKLKTTSGGSISLQPTDTAALLTQSLPAESGTVLLKETAAANAVYVPAGTGAVASTVQGKLRESISVLDFYANGVSGVAVDPTGAVRSDQGIQAAINYASANGYELHIPPGIYRINSGLVITPPLRGGFRIAGCGWSTIDNSYATESGSRLYYYGTGSAITILGTALDKIDNVTIEGLSVENKSGATGSTIGIHIEYSRWCKFKNVYVQGFNIGIDNNHLSWMHHFVGCVVYNNATYGVNNQSDGEDSLFENCFVRYNGVAGVVVNQAKNNTFINCDFGNNPKGFLVYGANSGSVPQITLIGCIWEDCATYCLDINTAGLSASYYPQINIIGGRMYDSGTGGTIAINAVLWNQINIIGVESNYSTFIDTSAGAGNYGPVFLQGIKIASGNTLFNGNKASLRLIGGRSITNVTSFNGSWSAHAENSVYYYKDANNIVHIGGQVQSGTIGSVVFALPAGFRPQSISRFAVPSNGAFGECYIDAGGQVYALVGDATRFSFEGISFYAEN